MTSPDTKPTSRFSAVPIFTQLIGLCVLVLVLSILVNAALVIFSPPPQPSGYTVEEAVSAIRKGETTLKNGKQLKATTLATRPEAFSVTAQTSPSQGFDPQRRFRFLSEVIRTHVARKLNVPLSDVSVYMADRPRAAFLFDRNKGPRPDRDVRFNADAPGPQMPRPVSQDSGPQGPDEQRAESLGPMTQGPVGPAMQRPDIQPGMQGPDVLDPNGSGRPGDGPRFVMRMQGPSDSAGRPEIFRAEAGEASINGQVTFPAFGVAVRQADGKFRVLTPPRTWLEPWQWRLLLGLALTAVCITPLAYVLSKRLSAPMVALAEGAAQIGFGPEAVPLRVTGPKELRAATDVLNAMQVRLKSYVDNRTALITAIAHDLKTPLARLRLRVETLPKEHKEKFNADIGHMDALINSALNFATAERQSLRLVPMDLSSLIESLCEDMEGLHPVKADDIEPGLTVRGDDTALKRILTNLIENAQRYGGDCEIVAHNHPTKSGFVEVLVRDTGPGLPDTALETVFEPFYRLETSRNRDTGGVGLGLSLARKLTEAHEGTLILRNRLKDGEIAGLEAVISFPKWSKSA